MVAWECLQPGFGKPEYEANTNMYRQVAHRRHGRTGMHPDRRRWNRTVPSADRVSDLMTDLFQWLAASKVSVESLAAGTTRFACTQFALVQQKRVSFEKANPLICMCWSGRSDSNTRPPAPKAGALTRLRYAPTVTLLRSEGKVFYTIRARHASLFPENFREKGGSPARCILKTIAPSP